VDVDRGTSPVEGRATVRSPLLDRAAGVAIAMIGALLAALVVEVLLRSLPDLGSPDPHLAGDATMTLIVAGLPLAMAAAAALGVALLLWRGKAGGRPAAAVVALLALAFSWVYNGFGSVVWLARTWLSQPEALVLDWPLWRWNPWYAMPDVILPPRELWPSGRLDTLDFWLPGLLAIAAALALLFLGIGAVRRNGRRSTSA
jgi:hypothetical protein